MARSGLEWFDGPISGPQHEFSFETRPEHPTGGFGRSQNEPKAPQTIVMIVTILLLPKDNPSLDRMESTG